MKFFTSLLCLISISVGLAQSSDAFLYRSVVLDSMGQARANENFEIEVKIQDGKQANENLKYAERHSVLTDSLGWYSVKIGAGVTADMYHILSDIDWKGNEKYLYVKVFEPRGNVVGSSIIEIVESPSLSFAKNVESKALMTLNCFSNLEALRKFEVPENGDMICVKGHTSVRDGGEGFFYFNSTLIAEDDDGIIIKPKDIDQDNPGRWVRHLDGYINVNYYGIRAGRKWDGTSISEKIQRVIDFAGKNTAYSYAKNKVGEYANGNTVFFPSGQYFIDGSLVLPSGVRILGEENTLLTARKNANFDYFFKMAAGKVIISMENLRINGNGVANVGGMFFKSRDGKNGTGGLWQSRFKNINIVNVEGHGIFLEGSDSMGVAGERDYSLPNQMNVFENVRVTRLNNDKNSLRMTQYQGQHTFINCLFLGKRDRSTLGTNVFISQPGANVVSFINCTIQESIYGFRMIDASNVTIDNCWFENLYISVDVTDGRSINVLNSRFSNAAGYGSEGHTGPESLPANTPNGSCINSENSVINIERNYVRVSDVNSPEAHKSTFIFGRKDRVTFSNNNTINSRDNTFVDPRLSRTIGIERTIPVESRTIILDGGTNVAAAFNNNTVLRKIESTASGGQQITLKINKFSGTGTVKIKDWGGVRRKGNISLNGQKQLVLSHGQEITFLKVDAPMSDNGDRAIYKLVSVTN
ncbi:MAG: right-handed parallel beta-helix repeat-containing protein [Flavobacteriaceae bacterium]|nr:right-handed parallel beta-helix repeat-containing protein [Flavobacteriaceae bacterium]